MLNERFYYFAVVYEYSNYCDLSGFKALNKIDFGNNLLQLKVLKDSGSGNKTIYGITKLYAV